MKQFTFPLPDPIERRAFEQAAKLVREAQAAGWRLLSAGPGFSGGLPAAQFVLDCNDQHESVTCMLGKVSLAAFAAAARQLSELPLDQWQFAKLVLVEDGKAPQGVLVAEPAGQTRRVPKASRRATQRRARSVTPRLQQAQQQTPSAYDLPEAAALEALRRGEGPEADRLRALVGDDYFALLSGLAQRSPAKRGRRPKALVLPGIMGSKLGTQKTILFGTVPYSDVIWLDPVDMRLGRLANLTLGPDGRPQHGTQAVGVLYSFYLRLKLSLDLAGFDADFHAYDWRRPVRELGTEFARFLSQQKEPVTVVAHSMGGIVTRAALKAGAKNLQRLVMIGTPNHGSFVPAQALRAAYPFLKTLEVTFDRDLEAITEDVFASFAGLYDLLPAKEKFPNFPIFEPGEWPASRPRPNARWIKAAAVAQSQLAPADDRFHLICGVGEDTVVDVRVEGDEFVFLQTKDGDGTVPRISAELPGCPTLYVKGSHGMLPNYGSVCDLAVDLALTGKTSRETLAWKPPAEAPQAIRESALRSTTRAISGVRRGEEPSPTAVREMLAPLLGLPSLEAEASSPPPPTTAPTMPSGRCLFGHELKGVVVGRRRRQLEVALFQGSLTAVPSRAYLLGLFQGVAPAGAALAVDRLMNGVISDFVQRRMLSGRLGEVFIVPKGRSAVLADHVVFIGLGPFDRFKDTQSTDSGDPDAMRLVCESVVRSCLHANIEEFATVLLGGSAAASTEDAVRLFSHSFLDALRTADPTGRLRRITLCERDDQRMSEIRTALVQLATTDLFKEVELELSDLPKPVEPEPRALPVGTRTSVAAGRPTPLYLIARMVEAADLKPGAMSARPDKATRVHLETSLLLNRSKAAVLNGSSVVPIKRKDDLLALIQSDPFNPALLEKLGRGLVELVFDDALRDALERQTDSFRELPLVVVHDPVASQLPWESLRIGNWVPALTGGLTRQQLDANLSVAKWLEERVDDGRLDVLLVTNPTGDLTGAEGEGEAIRAMLNQLSNVRVTVRHRSEATKTQLLSDFRSGQFDVVHYAGHAFFSPLHPGRSGLICAGKDILAGTDLAGLSNLPALIFFNACESGRIRGSSGAKPKLPTVRKPRVDNVSVASAFIRGGVANFLGTYWPVGDAPAKKFAETFYPLLVQGRTIGDAVLAGRRAVEATASVDWADYLLYGNPDFVLKRAKD